MHIEAMHNCLLQILTKKGPPSFFSNRVVIDQELRFNGALVWNLTAESSILSVSESPKKGKIRAIFEQTGGCRHGNWLDQKGLAISNSI
jgi:hypothetical protein